MSDAGSDKRPPLVLPGRLYVGATDPSVVELDVAAGWMHPRGILNWTHEVSVVARGEINDDVKRALSLAAPHEHIVVAKHPNARRAAQANPIAQVSRALAAKLVEKGVRVHTIGFDKVSTNFFYFAEGGTQEPTRIQGDLLEMIAPVLTYGSENADIDRHMARLVDRMVATLSGGVLTELRVELADALPPLAEKGSIVVDVDEFEKTFVSLVKSTEKWKSGAESIAQTLEAAAAGKDVRVPIHLFGEATRVSRTAMDLVVGGHRIALPGRVVFVVSGAISDRGPVSIAPVAAEEDDWGGDDAETVKPAEVAPKPVAKPVEAKPVEAKPIEAKPVAKPVTTPKAPEVKATPKPVEAKPITPKAPEVKAPEVKAKPIEAKPVTPKAPEVKATPLPKPVEVKPVTPKAPEVKAPEPTKPVEVVAPPPKPIEPKPIEVKPIEVVAAVATPIAQVAPIAATPPKVEAPEDDEDDDDEADSEPDQKAASSGEKSGKTSRKAAKKAAARERRLAAKEANRTANAPKPKARVDEPEAKPEPKPEKKIEPKPEKKTEKPLEARTKSPPVPLAREEADQEEDGAPPKKKGGPPMAIIIVAALVFIAIVVMVLLKKK